MRQAFHIFIMPQPKAELTLASARSVRICRRIVDPLTVPPPDALEYYRAYSISFGVKRLTSGTEDA